VPVNTSRHDLAFGSSLQITALKFRRICPIPPRELAKGILSNVSQRSTRSSMLPGRAGNVALRPVIQQRMSLGRTFFPAKGF